jgi:hypothetical protein
MCRVALLSCPSALWRASQAGCNFTGCVPATLLLLQALKTVAAREAAIEAATSPWMLCIQPSLVLLPLLMLLLLPAAEQVAA